MKHNSPTDFYGDVDRARYRANWSCLVWFFVIALILGSIGWFAARYFGYL